LYLVIAAYSLTLILFFVCARFRQPILPYFIFFAVLGGIELVRRIRFEKINRYILPLFVLVLLLFESNHDMIDSEHGQYTAEGYLNVGLAYMKTNRLAKAEIEFLNAVKADSTFAPAYSNLGVISVRQGKKEQATEYFRKALNYDRSSAERFMNLANILSDRGDYMGAVRILESGYQTFPDDPKLLLLLSMGYAQIGELERARRSMELVMQLDPDNDAARQAYQTILNLIEEQNAKADSTK
jgi:Tfp pilus assembly protein PilF